MTTEHDANDTPEQMAQKRALGVTINLSELQRQDGLIAESIDKSNHIRLGVIQQTITAIKNDADYRQILFNTRWKNREEQDKCINALAYCEMTGAVQAKKIILDRLTARSSGIDGESIKAAYEALTHTTFTTHHTADKYWRRNNGNGKSNSPIA